MCNLYRVRVRAAQVWRSVTNPHCHRAGAVASATAVVRSSPKHVTVYPPFPPDSRHRVIVYAPNMATIEKSVLQPQLADSGSCTWLQGILHQNPGDPRVTL
jgi:hypothetical protein